MASYLYVEDDKLSREVMRILLVDVIGTERLTIFEDSENFLERLKSIRPTPDFVLLDLDVPPRDGYAIIEMIRNDPDTQDLTVLAVTASAIVKIIGQLEGAGFDGAIAKPVDMLTFPGIIRQLEAGDAIWNTD